MKRTGKELEFISWIKRDGSGTKMVKKSLIKLMENDVFEMTCLSMSKGTFIASKFNSFVVKIKTK